MSLREPVVVSEGWRVVVGGMNAGTRRDPTLPRGFRGLSADDASLLHAWCSRVEGGVRELHTDVPVGCIPEVDEEWFNEWHRDHAARIHPLRIDAIALVKDGWLVIECKPDAGYVALGQLLCYGYYAGMCRDDFDDYKLAVVTDVCQPAVRPVFEAYEVRVFEVGDVVIQR